jgi:uncharacterized OsmC-like protein
MIAQMSRQGGCPLYPFLRPSRRDGQAEARVETHQEDTSRTKPFILDADEPDVLLGEDHGANPVKYVLHALAACVTTALVYHAAAHGIRIDEVEPRLEGDLDLRGFLGISDEVRNGYENIRMTFRVKADVPDDQLEELCQMGPRFSPVFDIITNRVPVSVRLERQ